MAKVKIIAPLGSAHMIISEAVHTSNCLVISSNTSKGTTLRQIKYNKIDKRVRSR